MAFFLGFMVPVLAFGRSAYPSLLPSNPFYFTKEGVRNLRRAFTFGSIGKADLESRIADERLAEIVRLANIKSVDQGSVKSALESYLENLDLLREHLSDLRAGAQGLDKLLDRLAATVINHGLIFNELNYEKASDAKSNLVEILESTVDHLQSLEELRARIQAVTFSFNNPLKELKTLELLVNVNEFLKEDLLVGLVSNIQSGEVNFRSIENLSGDLLARLKIIDGARERVIDVVLRSQISFLRQQLLDKITTTGLLNSAIINNEIDNVQKKLDSWNPNKGSRLTEQVKFSLVEGQKALIAGDYGVALSQVSLANAILNNMIFELSLSVEARLREIFLIKQEYDLLPVKNRSIFLDRQILELSDLIKKDPLNDRVMKGIREIKLIIAHAR